MGACVLAVIAQGGWVQSAAAPQTETGAWAPAGAQDTRARNREAALGESARTRKDLPC
jgi:hypothetical protein